jgi:hypothetical protein
LALNGTVAAQGGQKWGPDTPSNPRRLTTDPCNKVWQSTHSVETKGGLTRPGADRWVTDCRPAHLHLACADSLRVRMTSFGWRFRTSTTGARATRSSAITCRKIDVSRMPSRIQPNSHHDEAESKRDAPPPAQKLVPRHLAERQDREVRDEETGRPAILWPCRDEPPIPACARPFHRQQDRALWPTCATFPTFYRDSRRVGTSRAMRWATLSMSSR